jgi:hypothetical protein
MTGKRISKQHQATFDGIRQSDPSKPVIANGQQIKGNS